MTKKSILEEALLEAQALEDAVKSNAKEILASTMKQEIEELVKESLSEQEEIEDYIEDSEEEALINNLVGRGSMRGGASLSLVEVNDI